MNQEEMLPVIVASAPPVVELTGSLPLIFNTDT